MGLKGEAMDKTCGKCKHHCRPHYYRRDWLYCEKRPGNTQFNLLKVKSRRPGCSMFEIKEKTKAHAEPTPGSEEVLRG